MQTFGRFSFFFFCCHLALLCLGSSIHVYRRVCNHFSEHICFVSLCVQVRFQYAFETVSGFILPYTIIIISYVLILKRLKQTKFRRKVRSEKLILAIVVMFGLFWLPYHVINMIQVCDGTWNTHFWFKISYLIIWMNTESVLIKVAAEWFAEDSPRRELWVITFSPTYFHWHAVLSQKKL